MIAPSIQAAADQILAHFEKQGQRAIRMATPLGLGKPNQLVNEVYARVAKDDRFTLNIYTALSLDPPVPKKGFEARFAGPFLDRHFGKDYPRLQYIQDIRAGNLPPNINVQEFYIEAGRYREVDYVQQHYSSLNYTHVVRGLAKDKVNLILQLVGKRGDQFSISSNTDLTLDLLDALKAERPFFVGVVHPDMPFVGGDAALQEKDFDLILDSKEVSHQLFALPRGPIDEVDMAIGLQASQLVVDDGSLQIGIGSLSDALVHSLILRQNDNERYQKLMEDLCPDRSLQDWKPALEPFQKGLYGTSEMVMDGFMHLRKAGILKRVVQDSAKDIYVHGAFFLGTKEFYKWLRELQGDDFNGFAMTRVSKVNDLYDQDENLLRKQRRNARFFNTCMQVTLLGGAASDTLANGRVISGVGGQYNFVAMSHELPDASSILMLRSTSVRDGKRMSHIIESHGHLTIPRHLRDIVVTEYGVASLMGKNDRDVALQLIAISDAAFQDELLAAAIKMGKIPPSTQIPFAWRRNTPENLRKRLRPHREWLPVYPFGSDFQPLELRILKALGLMKSMDSWQRLLSLATSLALPRGAYREERTRMGFEGKNPGLEERLFMAALAQTESRFPI